MTLSSYFLVSKDLDTILHCIIKNMLISYSTSSSAASLVVDPETQRSQISIWSYKARVQSVYCVCERRNNIKIHKICEIYYLGCYIYHSGWSNQKIGSTPLSYEKVPTSRKWRKEVRMIEHARKQELSMHTAHRSLTTSVDLK
jgi:hypothetical protein